MKQKLLSILLLIMGLYIIIPQGGDSNAADDAQQSVQEDSGLDDSGPVPGVLGA